MISDDYILGFVEGEGCFNVTVAKYWDDKPRKGIRKRENKRKITGFRIKPSFRITLAEKDKGVLEAIREKFGFGQIYSNPRHEKNKNQQNVVQYCVYRIQDLLRLAEFFKKQTFYTTKGNDFQLWMKMLGIIESGEHLTDEGTRKLCELRDSMNFTEGKKRKRPTEEIEELLRNKSQHILAYNDQNKLNIHNANDIF